ncbi:MAG: hypothetical protein AAGA11_22210 [Pseudomonadota bacterium]
MTPHLVAVVLAAVTAAPAGADAPDLQSGTPVVYLADNLDEQDKLGWCIDTKGRGFNENLHAHSCKPATRGISDTQFAYDADSGHLRSVPFEGKCMQLRDRADPVFPFALLDCVDDAVSQRFVHDPNTRELRIGADPSHCVVVATQSTAAGPFMSRDLLVALCDSVAEPYKQWIALD